MRVPVREPQRVVLINPGDILLIGNVVSAGIGKSQADLRPLAERVGSAVEALEKIGILAFMFAGDIEIAKIPGLAECTCRHIDDGDGGNGAHP